MAPLRRFVRVAAFAVCLAATPQVGAQLASDVTISAGQGGDLSVSVFSAAYQATNAQAAVIVGTEVHGLAERPARGGEPRRLELRYLVTRGPSALSEQSVSVPLGDEAAISLARREGVRVLTKLSLAPGRYRVQVTTRDGGNETGSVIHDIDVPVLTDSSVPIKMSGLLLSSSAVGGLTHADVEDDHRMLPITGRPPAARRAFSRSEKVEVHAELYEEMVPELEFDQQMKVITRVRSAGGDLVWETKDDGTSEALPGGRFGYVHSTLIPVSTFAPGNYVVEVGAETLYGVPGYVSRSVPFTVISPGATP